PLCERTRRAGPHRARVSIVLRRFRSLAGNLRQIVGNRKPRSLVGDVHMKPRSDSRIVIQRAERQAQILWVSIEFAHDRGATYPAKTSVISWRGFIESNGAFA